MNTQPFQDLKQMLTSSENFSETFDFFFQNFAEQTSFYERGEPSMNEMLITSLKAIGEKFMGKDSKISNYRMTEIHEENFIHGTCFIDEQIVFVIFFTDLNIGLASLSMGGSMFNFVQLKATFIPDGMGVQFTKDKFVS